jgi:hypothetical protein
MHDTTQLLVVAIGKVSATLLSTGRLSYQVCNCNESKCVTKIYIVCILYFFKKNSEIPKQNYLSTHMTQFSLQPKMIQLFCLV